MSNPLFDPDVKQIGGKTIIDVGAMASRIAKEVAGKVDELCEADFDELARKRGFIRLAPDEVVVKRATAEHARRLSDCYHCDDPDCRCGECEADLEAALEGGR